MVRARCSRLNRSGRRPRPWTLALDDRCALRTESARCLVPPAINMDRPTGRKVLWINRFMDRLGAGPPSFRPPVARFSGSGLQASEGAPSPPRLFLFRCRPHHKRGFDQGRLCRQRQGFPGLKRTIREFEARIALMPRSGNRSGIGPGPPSRFTGNRQKEESGSVETELKPR